jgi:hypothetical protein
MLPQFPFFFKDIYEIKNQIQICDTKMASDIERLWERTK